MSATLAPRSMSVPAEFVGRARRLRDAIAAEDRASGELVQCFVDRMQARRRRGHAIPRADTLAGIAFEWRHRMPTRGRLLIELDFNRRKKTLSVKEMRATSSVYQPQEWDIAERGLLVGLIAFRAEPFLCELAVHTLAHVGMHALARRVQRGLDASDEAIMRDLRALGQAHHDLADQEEGAEFRVALDHGGMWVGLVQLVLDRRIGYDKALAVRTYLASSV